MPYGWGRRIEMTAVLSNGRGLVKSIVPSANPFASVPETRNFQEKPYERMDPAQRRWFDVVQRRTQDPNWQCGGVAWDQLKWELHYLFGYTWLPSKELGGFIHGGIDLLKSVGLVVVSHFWMNNPKRQAQGQDPEVGIAVRLYRVTFDESTGEIVYGFNGQTEDTKTSSSFAKNLAFLPYAGSHGATFDPAATPALFETALAIEEQMQVCATPQGRRYLSSPVFPSCLFGFTQEQLPDYDEINESALKEAALRYLTMEDENGFVYNGDVLEKLQITDETGVIDIIDEEPVQWVIKLESGDKIKLPRCVVLRDNIRQGTVLERGLVLGDFMLPRDARQAATPWQTLEDEVGEYAASWLLEATLRDATVRHRFGGNDLFCLPHVLVPGTEVRVSQKFLDMRDSIGRNLVNPADMEQVLRQDGEARITVCHMGQTACAEAMQFSWNGGRADLWNVRPYWEKHFKAGRAPIGRRNNRS